MKQDSINVGYGFYIESITRSRRKNKCEVEVYYYNNSTNEPLTLTYEFVRRGLLRTLKEYNMIENLFKNYSVWQAIAFVINNSSYVYKHEFDEAFDSYFLDTIPDSLIKDNYAINKLISNLNMSRHLVNKHLIVHICEYVKNRRKIIEEEAKAYLEENKETFDKYEQLKEEFGF